MRQALWTIAAAMVLAHGAAHAATAADIERSVGLRESWMYLTENLADRGVYTPDGKAYVYRKTVPGGFSFVRYDLATRQKAAAFDHARLAEGLAKATGGTVTALRLPFDSFEWAEGETAIRFIDHETGWRCTLTDYRCAKPERMRQPRGFGVVRDVKIAADNRPKTSPDGKWEAAVENFNIAVRPASGGAWKRLSSDGSEGEFYDPESIVWSPDSQKIAAYRVRPGFRRIVYKVESSPKDQVEPKLTAQLYPKPGDAVDIDQPALFHVATGRQVAVPGALFAHPYQMTGLTWRKDSATVSFLYDQRGHQLVRVVEIDAATGKPRVVVEEATGSFVNMGRSFRHELDNGRRMIWMSERSGWNHLYMVDGRSGALRPITKGPWVVREVVKVDEAKGRIYFLANGLAKGRDPYFQHFYRVDFDGRNLTALTSEDAYHDIALSPDGESFVDTWSRVDLPPVAALRRTSDGAVIDMLERADVSKLTAAGFKAPEPFVAKGRDGATDIYGLVVKPRDFDPKKTYPVIENIYAGPHSSFVPKTFWPFGYHAGGDKVIGMQALADLGFIVVQIDGMGTLNRSKAFHDVTWKNIADAGFPDRILWHKALAAKNPWYDISRVGIYGGSAGGQDTLLGLLFHPDFYKVGVAFAGCFDNRMDKISWNEQWMGWPVDESYSRSSGVDNAWRLQGKLLMIVGELDSNVDPASTMQVADALIKANKVFDLLVIPGEGHSAGRGSGPIDYGQRKQFDFFLHELAGQETPNWNAKAAPRP